MFLGCLEENTIERPHQNVSMRPRNRDRRLGGKNSRLDSLFCLCLSSPLLSFSRSFVLSFVSFVVSSFLSFLSFCRSFVISFLRSLLLSYLFTERIAKPLVWPLQFFPFTFLKILSNSAQRIFFWPRRHAEMDHPPAPARTACNADANTNAKHHFTIGCSQANSSPQIPRKPIKVCEDLRNILNL